MIELMPDGHWAVVELVAIVSVLLNMEPEEGITHFTWWGLLALSAYDMTTSVDLLFNTKFKLRVWYIVICMEVTIVFGVLIMSALDCLLINDAHTTVGNGVYFVGNFIMHYWPITRLLAARPPTYDAGLLLPQVFDASAAIITYFALFHPTQIYGCEMPRSIGFLLMWSAAITFAGITHAVAMAHISV